MFLEDDFDMERMGDEVKSLHEPQMMSEEWNKLKGFEGIYG